MADGGGQQAYELFEAALAHEGEEREAFLDTACRGDPALRRAVEALLVADSEAGGFLEPLPPPPALAPRRLSLPCRVSHYEAQKLIGAGGMGAVYLARDLALGRRVALKVLHEEISPQLRSRHLTEADAFSRVQHPAIATFYEAGEVAGSAFVAMEYIEGVTLREQLVRRGSLPLEETLGMAASLLEALGHVHSAKLLHGDITPRNIMITGGGAVKLLDFGVAKQLWTRTDAAGRLENSVAENTLLFGTAGYTSPEQVRGDRVCPRSDLFAVGAVLYECLAGHPAFPGVSPLERIAGVLSRSVDPPAIDGIPDALNRILLRSLSRDREKRFPSAAAFLAALRESNSTAAVRSVRASARATRAAAAMGSGACSATQSCQRIARHPAWINPPRILATATCPP